MFNKLIAALLPYFPKKFVWLFSKPYIAGETVEDAIKASKDLNAKGCMVTIDILGEFYKTLDEVLHKMERQLRKKNEQVKDKIHRS